MGDPEGKVDAEGEALHRAISKRIRAGHGSFPVNMYACGTRFTDYEEAYKNEAKLNNHIPEVGVKRISHDMKLTVTQHTMTVWSQDPDGYDMPEPPIERTLQWTPRHPEYFTDGTHTIFVAEMQLSERNRSQEDAPAPQRLTPLPPTTINRTYALGDSITVYTFCPRTNVTQILAAAPREPTIVNIKIL